MKTLRIQVERVVRPIQASSQRKDRMREELLAHLTCLFDEELAKTGDVKLATDDAIRRFGDATSLTHELQASVSWPERWAFFRLLDPIRRRQGESPLGHMLRTNIFASAAVITTYAFVSLLLGLFISHRPPVNDAPSVRQLLVFLSCTAVIQCAVMASGGLLCEWIRQNLANCAADATASKRRRAIARITGYTAVSAAIFGAYIASLVFLFVRLMPTFPITAAQFCWITLAAMILGVPLTLWAAWNWRATTRRFDDWDSLDLSENCVA
jgi:hypothetical protein